MLLRLVCAAFGRVLLALPLCACAQIFSGVATDGGTVLSNFQTNATPDVLIAPPAQRKEAGTGAAARARGEPGAVDDGAGANRRGARARPAADAGRIRSIIESVAREAALPAQLLHAVIAVESAFDVRAVSPKGAQGLMQLMPATARRFGVADPFDARQNIAGGAAYLKWLLQRFDGDLALALAAYNAGEDAVIRAGFRVPPFAETRAYVPRVLAQLRRTAP